jgi:putative membrane protein
MSELNLEQKYNKWIIAVSIIIPVAVSFGVKLKDFGYDVEPLSFTSYIRHTNGITAVLLIAGVISIKMVSVSFIDLMTTAVALSIAFVM